MAKFEYYRDTDPRALAVYFEALSRMTPGEKAARVFAMNGMVFGLCRAGLRRQYPHASEREIFLRAASRRLTPDQMIRVYGWDPQAA
jgi:hypothetical protein